MSDSCPLCDKLTRLRELPADGIVWQFPHSVALLGPWQYYTGYCMLVSRTHHSELHLLPPEIRRAFLDEMVILSQAIHLSFQPRKMNCESLGNQVPHLHWHLFPRRADDPETLKPVWLALERADHDEREKQRVQDAKNMPRGDITARLRHNLQQLHAPTP